LGVGGYGKEQGVIKIKKTKVVVWVKLLDNSVMGGNKGHGGGNTSDPLHRNQIGDINRNRKERRKGRITIKAKRSPRKRLTWLSNRGIRVYVHKRSEDETFSTV